MELPAGTVTFVFTDIEGSTRLLHELGTEAYVRALEDHRRLLREAFAGRGGIEVEMQGDSFHFAFADAGGAVKAAGEAQRALAAHGWEVEPVRVRIGLHSGEPLVSGRLYAGLDVHRAARVMSAAHGGQVLVSEATRALLGEGFELRDLGEHRLKDLLAPLRLFQLGEGEFPPLRSLYRTNLPVPATPFLGRERELAELSEFLAQGARLLTLTGPGGTGKTRLAGQAAAENAHEYPDGTFWVGLAALRDPALVVPTIAQALDAKGDLAEQIGDKRLLLVLDNLEQLVAAAPELAGLLAACSNLTLLATSREPLHLSAEREYAVAPLQAEDAVTLFRERARATGGELGGANGEIGEICRRLDQLPLAIELAAARVKTLPPHALLQRLEQRLPLLTGGARDLPERQRTLHATIAWSYELLTAAEQELFARLAVFAGGCSLEAAEEICRADLDTIHNLLDKNLLRRTDERYWMLETIREYAAEQLALLDPEDETQRRHTRFFFELAQQAEPELTRPDHAHWVGRLESESENLRSAMKWSLEREPAMAAAFAAALWRWWLSGRLAEGRRFCEAVLASPEPNDAERAKVLRGAAAVARTQGDHEEAAAFAEEALALYRLLGDPRGIADALLALANVAVATSQLDRAESLYEEALPLMRQVGYVPGVSSTLTNLGVVARYRGDYDRAQDYYRQSLELDRAAGDPKGTAITLLDLGHVTLAAGNAEEAVDSFLQSLRLFDELGELVGVSSCLDGLARAEATRQPARAARLWGAWERLLEDLGIQPTERDAQERAEAVAEGRRAANAEDFEAEWQAGRSLEREEVVRYALEPSSVTRA